MYALEITEKSLENFFLFLIYLNLGIYLFTLILRQACGASWSLISIKVTREGLFDIILSIRVLEF